MDLGWSELLLIGVVALIVIGPKDLPQLFRSLGRFTAKARAMAREFSSAMEEAAKSSGLDEASKSLNDVRSLTSKKNLGLDALERAADKFEKWDPKIPTAKGPAQPDPGSIAKTPASAASPAVTTAASAAAAPAAATATATATASASAAASGEGKRRIHAVRRSDMKDD
ncbi:Sec-independent protein translocase protein TatB [Paracoccus zhejiangensis]|uniref:Twin-arginine translocase subunit TatB n=1 Tax=Paracoccus zhejiangensis TaxID=1077935 RepID=A0A2H5EUP5_9RHOB|nr:Sec-independent protein translocase protein TatB [Paracoccus zhejiangensis]AUH63010.1 twin-arginine translocase subunit TatB [Paracoccus zhejiangensis]